MNTYHPPPYIGDYEIDTWHYTNENYSHVEATYINWENQETITRTYQVPE